MQKKRIIEEVTDIRVIEQLAAAKAAPPPRPFRSPLRQLPGRTLPFGHQWVGKDRPGGQACQRRLRQIEKAVAKAARTAQKEGTNEAVQRPD